MTEILLSLINAVKLNAPNPKATNALASGGSKKPIRMLEIEAILEKSA
jgi:hypothetical protein